MSTTAHILRHLGFSTFILFNAWGQAQASSLASSVAEAGSSASDSASSTLNTSSNSSGDNDKVAEGNYRIIQVATIPEKPQHLRITLIAEQHPQHITLDLPNTTWSAQQLTLGDPVRAKTHAYGLEFTRVDKQEAFFLVLNDDWYSELASRPLGAL